MFRGSIAIATRVRAFADKPYPRMHAALKLAEIELEPSTAQELEQTDGRTKALLLVRALHSAACERGYDAYIDPSTGYRVFTANCLRRTPCCGNGCRHCPHGHRNVPRSRP